MSGPSPTPIDDPARDAASLLLRVGLFVIAIAVPVSMALSREAVFILLPVGAAVVLVAGLLLSEVPLRRRIEAAAFSQAGVAGLMMLGWSALSLLWSPVGLEGAAKLGETAAVMLLVAATAAMLPERTRTSNLNLFPLGILLAVAVTLVVGYGLPRAGIARGEDAPLQRAIVTLVVLVWPALCAMAVRGRWVAAAVVVVAVMATAMVSWSTVTLAALGLGALAFVLGTGHPARAGRLIGAVSGLLVLLGPAVPFLVALALKGLDAALGARMPDLGPALEAMRSWADLVVAAPLRLVTGHGIDMTTVALATGFLPDTAPRSLLFEVWYDFGLVGAVLVAVLLNSAFGIVGRLSPTVAPFLLAAIVSMLVIVFSGLVTTQLWWVTVAGLVALSFACVARGEYRTTRPTARLEPQVATLPR